MAGGVLQAEWGVREEVQRENTLQEVAEGEAQHPPVPGATSQHSLALTEALLLARHPHQHLARSQLLRYSPGPDWSGYDGLALLQDCPGYRWGPAQRAPGLKSYLARSQEHFETNREFGK